MNKTINRLKVGLIIARNAIGEKELVYVVKEATFNECVRLWYIDMPDVSAGKKRETVFDLLFNPQADDVLENLMVGFGTYIATPFFEKYEIVGIFHL